MARARNIKPGFFKNEDLAECTPWARLCFAGLWCLADRAGRLEDRPRRIKAELFPSDTVDVEPLLQELERWKFISRYEIDGLQAIQILRFAEHQTPHYSEKPSVIKPKDFSESGPPPRQGDSESTPRKEGSLRGGRNPLNPDSLNPESLPPKPPRGASVGFDRFWAAWPRSERKEGKGKCQAVWDKGGFDAIADEILAHVELKKASLGWTKQGGEFIPAPLVYLNGRKWEGVEDLGADQQRSFV